MYYLRALAMPIDQITRQDL